MKRKYVTEAFMMISNCQKSFDLFAHIKIAKRFKGCCYRDYGEEDDM